MNLLVGLILGLGCLCFCVISIVIGYYQINVSKNVGALPISFQFKKKTNNRLLGHTINTINDISEDDCVKKCYDNPYCLGATYKIDKKNCDLQYVNAETTPNFVSDWDNSSLYSRIDPSSAFEITENNYLDSLVVKQIATKTAKDCAIACVGFVGNSSDEQCLSANYSNGMCDILMETRYNNPAAYGPKPNVTHLHRKGMIGGQCKGGLDCIFGVCKDGKCLSSTAAPAGEKCIQNYECQSGVCAKTEIPIEAQEKQRQTLLTNSSSSGPGYDAKFCDKYKTQDACEKTEINKTTSSGATCIWNKNVCFPKTIKRYTYICT